MLGLAELIDSLRYHVFALETGIYSSPGKHQRHHIQSDPQLAKSHQHNCLSACRLIRKLYLGIWIFIALPNITYSLICVSFPLKFLVVMHYLELFLLPGEFNYAGISGEKH